MRGGAHHTYESSSYKISRIPIAHPISIYFPSIYYILPSALSIILSYPAFIQLISLSSPTPALVPIRHLQFSHCLSPTPSPYPIDHFPYHHHFAFYRYDNIKNSLCSIALPVLVAASGY